MREEWTRFGHKVEEARAEIEAREFCVVIGDWQANLAAVAVPMKSTLNRMALAINRSVPAQANGRQRLERLGPKLVGL